MPCSAAGVPAGCAPEPLYWESSPWALDAMDGWLVTFTLSGFVYIFSFSADFYSDKVQIDMSCRTGGTPCNFFLPSSIRCPPFHQRAHAILLRLWCTRPQTPPLIHSFSLKPASQPEAPHSTFPPRHEQCVHHLLCTPSPTRLLREPVPVLTACHCRERRKRNQAIL